MKKSYLLIAVIFIVIVSCNDEGVPTPSQYPVESTDGGGDDDEDPIIQDGD